MKRTRIALFMLVLALMLAWPAAAHASVGRIVVGYNAGTATVKYAAMFRVVRVSHVAPPKGDTRDCLLVTWQRCPYPFSVRVVNATLWTAHVPGPGMGYAKVLVNKNYRGAIQLWAIRPGYGR